MLFTNTSSLLEFEKKFDPHNLKQKIANIPNLMPLADQT